jgi:GNAT superfamily N-acetyltransferase
MSSQNPNIEIRLLEESDSIHDLTSLINRAYKRLADMGLRYVATWQDDDITQERIKGTECWVGILDGRIVATALLRDWEHSNGTPWYERPDVAVLGQFAVEPDVQGMGIGSAMLRHVENRAHETGASELALDTAESADHLIKWYEKRGYRFIDYVDWRPLTNYRSVILSKTLL